MNNTSYPDNPIFEGVSDVLMYVSPKNYNVPQYLIEAQSDGISKRIALGSIPATLIPGRTQVYIWHPHAIPIVQAEGLSMVDLVAELFERGLLWDAPSAEDFEWDPADYLLPDDYVPPGTLQVTCAVQADPALRKELEEKYLIRWHGGVVCASPLGKVRYILKRGETELPDHLKPYAHLIDAVRIVRVDDDGNPLEDQGGNYDEDDEEVY